MTKPQKRQRDTNHKPEPGRPWRGDAVADVPPGQAEEAADRVAGRLPVPVERALRADPGGTDEDGSTPRRDLSPEERERDDRENQEEKREAAAEAHAEDRARGTGTAPKPL